MNTDKYLSRLDYERFGFKIAKIDDFSEAPINLINKLKKEKVKLIISRIRSYDIILLNTLEEIGFKIKDTQVTYKYDLNKTDSIVFSNPNQLIIRDNKESDIDQLIKITENSFCNYGHYFADERLEKNKCIEIYKDWIQRSCLNSEVADKIIVAEKNNKILGYLTFKIYENNNVKYAVGGIGAVDSIYRNMGVFPAIAIKGLLWGIEKQLSWQEHNVITSNFAVNRAFSKIGFRIVESYITLHCWID